MKYVLQLLTANKSSLIHWGHGVREWWCIAHPCLVWENPPCWWYKFKGPPSRTCTCIHREGEWSHWHLVHARVPFQGCSRAHIRKYCAQTVTVPWTAGIMIISHPASHTIFCVSIDSSQKLAASFRALRILIWYIQVANSTGLLTDVTWLGSMDLDLTWITWHLSHAAFKSTPGILSVAAILSLTWQSASLSQPLSTYTKK